MQSKFAAYIIVPDSYYIYFSGNIYIVTLHIANAVENMISLLYYTFNNLSCVF